MKTVLVLNNDQMGHGDLELGHKSLGILLRKSGAIDGLESIVFYNAGVKLLVEGSPHLAELSLVEENGVDLLACVTCLRHFDIEPVVGTVSDMDSIIAEMSRADKVITL